MVLEIPIFIIIKTLVYGGVLLYCGYKLGQARVSQEFDIFINEMTEAKAFLPVVARNYLLKKLEASKK